MTIERQYIRQFLSENKKQSRKFENDNYLYAYTNRSRLEYGSGWIASENPADILEEFGKKENVIRKILVLKEENVISDIIGTLSANDSGDPDFWLNFQDALEYNDFLEYFDSKGNPIEWHEAIEELESISSKEELSNRLKNLFGDRFFGYFSYVSGEMPPKLGSLRGKVLKPTQLDLSTTDLKDLNWLKIVSGNSSKLKSVPKDLITPELCKIAVKKNGYALEYVPDKLKTPELCKIAVENDYSALEFVPNKLMTPELCKLAVEEYGGALRYVPDKFKTPELCKIAVEDEGDLKYVPDKFKTPELCKIAVENNRWALKHVPDKLMTPELCKLAVDSDGYALQFIPAKLKTPELCKLAVSKSGSMLEYVPDKLKTLELCKLAVENYDFALDFVPDHLKEQVKQELGMK